MKKGYGLIEVLVTLFIMSTLMLVEVNLVTKESVKYKKNIYLDREECCCNSALYFLDNEIHDVKNKSLKVDENSIILKKQNGDIYTIKPEKRSNGTRLVIFYYKVLEHKQFKNIIQEKLKDVKINKNKNTVCIFIESFKGKKFYKCIGVDPNIEDM